MWAAGCVLAHVITGKPMFNAILKLDGKERTVKKIAKIIYMQCGTDVVKRGDKSALFHLPLYKQTLPVAERKDRSKDKDKEKDKDKDRKRGLEVEGYKNSVGKIMRAAIEETKKRAPDSVLAKSLDETAAKLVESLLVMEPGDRASAADALAMLAGSLGHGDGDVGMDMNKNGMRQPELAREQDYRASGGRPQVPSGSRWGTVSGDVVGGSGVDVTLRPPPPYVKKSGVGAGTLIVSGVSMGAASGLVSTMAMSSASASASVGSAGSMRSNGSIGNGSIGPPAQRRASWDRPRRWEDDDRDRDRDFSRDRDRDRDRDRPRRWEEEDRDRDRDFSRDRDRRRTMTPPGGDRVAAALAASREEERRERRNLQRNADFQKAQPQHSYSGRAPMAADPMDIPGPTHSRSVTNERGQSGNAPTSAGLMEMPPPTHSRSQYNRN